MAFENYNWTCVSASMSQGNLYVDGQLLNAPNIFTYTSSIDSIYTITQANYFISKYKDLSVGDIILGAGSDGYLDIQVTYISSISVTTAFRVFTGGTVTEIDTGTGLTGGPITLSGTISFAPITPHTFWANLTSATAVPTLATITSLGATLLADSTIAQAQNTILGSLNPNLAVITDSSGLINTSITTSTELSYVHGVTSSIQNQINAITSSYVSSISATSPLHVSASTGSINLTIDNATTTSTGVASFNSTNFTVITGLVTSNNFTITAGTGLTGGGSLTLGGAITISLSTPVSIGNGGTNTTSFTSYAPICGGTTSTGALQSATIGFSNSGYAFISNGSSTLPTFQALSGLVVTSISATTPLNASSSIGALSLTINNATTSTVGVASFNATNFTVTTGSVTSNNFTITAGTGLTGGGSLTLGGSTTISLSTPINVSNGGTASTSFIAYAPICGGTTSTGALQSASSGMSNSGYVFTSTGSSSLPTWQSLSSLGVTSITGTANQVFANSTSGSAQTGAVTLTLPQNINTTSSPTFSNLTVSNNVAIGNTVNSGVGLLISPQTTAWNSCVRISGTFTGDDGGSAYGFNLLSIISPANNNKNVYGIFCIPQATPQGSNNIPNGYAFYGELIGSVGSGSLTNGYTAFFAAPSIGNNKIALYGENAAFGISGITPPSLGFLVQGQTSFGTSSNSYPMDIRYTSISSAFLQNIAGSITSSSNVNNLQAVIGCTTSLSPTATLSGGLAHFYSSPTFTPNTSNIQLATNFYADGGTGSSTLITYGYTGYFKNAAFGSAQQALYADSALIGTPSIYSGSIFNVGSLNQLRVDNAGNFNIGALNGTNTAATSYSSVTSSSNPVSAITEGWSFTVGSSDIYITQLGILDAAWPSGSRSVGIYIQNGNQLANVSVSKSDPLVGQYRYHSLGTTLKLQSGNAYVIVMAYVGGGTETLVSSVTGQTYGSAITFNAARNNLSQSGLPSIDNTINISVATNPIVGFNYQTMRNDFSVVSTTGLTTICNIGAARNGNLFLTGNAFDSTSDLSNGVAFVLVHNASGNRQLGIVASDTLASSSSTPMIRVSGNTIDCIATNASTTLQMQVGNSSGVYIPNLSVGTTTSPPSNGMYVAGNVEIGGTGNNNFGYFVIYTTPVDQQALLYLNGTARWNSGNGGSLTIAEPICASTGNTVTIGSCAYFVPNFGDNQGILANAIGLYIDNAGAGSGIINNGYGAFIRNPSFGTNKTALYIDNLSIGFTGISPPTNGFSVSGNVSFFNSTGSFGSGTGVIFIANRSGAPSSNPVGGGLIYAASGAGTWRGSSGTITTFGPADPHCPVCESDFGFEWENDNYGGNLRICGKCLSDELGIRPYIRWNENKIAA